MANPHGYGLAHIQQPSSQNAWSNEDLKAALRAASTEAGRPATKTIYDRWRAAQPDPATVPSSSRIASRFGTWLAALAACGLEAGARSRAQATRTSTPRMSARRDREHWSSDGCDWFASCFTCPLSRGCRWDYDDPAAARREAEECTGFLLRN